MKRRQKGTGTIVKTGNWYYGRIVRKGSVQVVKLSKNAREAESLWREWLVREHPTATAKAYTPKHSMDDAWAKSVESYRVRAISKSMFVSFSRYYYVFKSWMENRNKQYLEDITAGDVAEYMEEATKNQSKCTKKTHLYMIRDLWNNSLPEVPNPTKNIKITAVQGMAREPFTDEELVRILERASNYRYFPCEFKCLIQVGLYTGLRLTDCVHLKVENIKDDSIQIVPKKTTRKQIVVRIPLHKELKRELDTLQVKSGFYFQNLAAMYDRMETTFSWHLGRIFKDCVETTATQAGRKRKVPLKGFHALRATFITRLAQNGVTLPIIETLAGHLNPQMTLHYTHPDENTKRNAISTLPNFGNANSSQLTDEIQTVINKCKMEIQNTIERLTGNTVQVQISTSAV